MKKIIARFINGFSYSIGITLVVQFAGMLITGKVPMLPDFLVRFDDSTKAFALQLLLIGIMSGITSAGTVVFEAEKIGLILQSFLFLMIMLAAWIPVSCFVWAINKYRTSMIVTLLSIVVTYAICWAIAYSLCRRDVQTINEELIKKEN